MITKMKFWRKRNIVVSSLLLIGCGLVLFAGNALTQEKNSFDIDTFSDEQKLNLETAKKNLKEQELAKAVDKPQLPAHTERASYDTYLLLCAALTEEQFTDFQKKEYFHKEATFEEYNEIANAWISREEYINQGVEKTSESQQQEMYSLYVASFVKQISPAK